MPPEIPLDIWWANIPWGSADYPRPVVFVGHKSNVELVVVRVSSRLDLRSEDDFIISIGHPDFPATGLTDESYAEAQAFTLPPGDFRNRIGKLEGELREDFERWLQGVL